MNIIILVVIMPSSLLFICFVRSTFFPGSYRDIETLFPPSSTPPVLLSPFFSSSSSFLLLRPLSRYRNFLINPSLQYHYTSFCLTLTLTSDFDRYMNWRLILIYIYYWVEAADIVCASTLNMTFFAGKKEEQKCKDSYLFLNLIFFFQDIKTFRSYWDINAHLDSERKPWNSLRWLSVKAAWSRTHGVKSFQI